MMYKTSTFAEPQQYNSMKNTEMLEKYIINIHVHVYIWVIICFRDHLCGHAVKN